MTKFNPFYAVCTPGRLHTGLSIKMPECETVEQARKHVPFFCKPNAIYKFTWGLKPEFIEGDDWRGSAKEKSE